uniref:Uncharacterized protein n=1 Tax=Naja naja TaxID=35670 RepID=A0A8C6VPX0_NAJNA
NSPQRSKHPLASASRITSALFSKNRAEKVGETKGFSLLQIKADLQTYSSYLSHIHQILTTYADKVLSVQLDISNLSHNIQQQMEEGSLTSVVYPQAENEPRFVEVQREIGSYLVLCKLQKFMNMIFWALRHCNT